MTATPGRLQHARTPCNAYTLRSTKNALQRVGAPQRAQEATMSARKSLGDVTNDLPAPPPTTTVKPPTPPPPTTAAQRLAAAAAARPPVKSSGYGQRSVTGFAHQQRPAAATRIAAVARGRTGRRRSMEIRNARPTTSTSRGPRSVMNRTTTASRRRDVRTSQTTRAPSTDRWNSTTRSVSRPRSTNLSRSAVMPCARAAAAKEDAAPPAPNAGEIDSEAAIRAVRAGVLFLFNVRASRRRRLGRP